MIIWNKKITKFQKRQKKNEIQQQYSVGQMKLKIKIQAVLLNKQGQGLNIRKCLPNQLSIKITSCYNK